MKKLLVLCIADQAAGKKLARAAKKQYEKLWGKGTCEVVVLPLEANLMSIVEEPYGLSCVD